MTEKLVKVPIHLFGLHGRYATALYSAAVKQKQLEATEKYIMTFKKLFLEETAIKEFLISPIIKKNLKLNAVSEITKKYNFNILIKRFLGNDNFKCYYSNMLVETVIENNRMKIIDQILTSFCNLMSAHRKEVICEVITTKALDETSKTELEKVLKNFLTKKETLVLNCKIDPKIIGGMIVSIGDKHIDMSIGTKMKKYEQLLSIPI